MISSRIGLDGSTTVLVGGAWWTAAGKRRWSHGTTRPSQTCQIELGHAKTATILPWFDTSNMG
jgi:hypothetical protein